MKTQKRVQKLVYEDRDIVHVTNRKVRLTWQVSESDVLARFQIIFSYNYYYIYVGSEATNHGIFARSNQEMEIGK